MEAKYIRAEQLVRPRNLLKHFREKKIQVDVDVRCMTRGREVVIKYVEHFTVDDNVAEVRVDGVCCDRAAEILKCLLTTDRPTKLYVEYDTRQVTEYVSLRCDNEINVEIEKAAYAAHRALLSSIARGIQINTAPTCLELVDGARKLVTANGDRPKLELIEDVKKSGAVFSCNSTVPHVHPNAIDCTLLNQTQAAFIDLVRRPDCPVIFLDSDAGTGKTFVSDVLAAEYRTTVLLPNHKLRSLLTGRSSAVALTLSAAVKRIAFRNMRMSPGMMREQLQTNLPQVLARVSQNIATYDEMNDAFLEKDPDDTRPLAFPELIIIDEAAMSDWREILIFRELVRLRNGTTRLLIMGDTTQNSPFNADADNGHEIHARCSDIFFQFERNMRSTDERLVSVLRNFHSAYPSPWALRRILRFTLWRHVPNCLADDARLIQLADRVKQWMRDPQNAALVLPRVITLTNQRADVLNFALQRLLYQCAIEEEFVVHVTRRKMKKTDSDDGDVFDQPYSNSLLLVPGMRYRYVGNSMNRQNLSRDETVVLREYEAANDEVVLHVDSTRQLVRMPRIFYEETRISVIHTGSIFYGFPLIPDFALTQYKAQGDTLPLDRELYIDALGMSAQALYVSLSRMRSLNQLRCICNL